VRSEGRSRDEILRLVLYCFGVRASERVDLHRSVGQNFYTKFGGGWGECGVVSIGTRALANFPGGGPSSGFGWIFSFRGVQAKRRGTLGQS